MASAVTRLIARTAIPGDTALFFQQDAATIAAVARKLCMPQPCARAHRQWERAVACDLWLHPIITRDGGFCVEDSALALGP